MRTRETGEPIDSAGSTVTPAIGPFGSSLVTLVIGSAPTLRKSSTSVNASGRVVTYGTGSLASITSDALRALTRELMPVSRASEIFVAPAACDTTPEAAAIATDRYKPTRLVTASPSRLQATATTCEPPAAF